MMIVGEVCACAVAHQPTIPRIVPYKHQLEESSSSTPAPRRKDQKVALASSTPATSREDQKVALATRISAQVESR